MPSASATGKDQPVADFKDAQGSKEGRAYEKISLALLAKNGYRLSKDKNSHFREFSIGREISIGEDVKVDDIVLRYIDQDNKGKLIFVQIKHKQDEHHQIDSEILSAEESTAKNVGGRDGGLRRDFNLQKYFISYLSLKENLKSTAAEEFKNCTIKYIAIFTNVGLNTRELEKNGFKLKPAPDDVINLFTSRKSSETGGGSNQCYQLSGISDGLRKILEKSSDLHRLARELAQYVIWKKYSEGKIMGKDKAPINHYHVELDREVFKKSDQIINKQSKKDQYREACFREDFVDNNEPGPKQNLRDQIIESIKELDESKKAMSNDELKQVLREAQWKVVSNFGESKKSVKNVLSEWIPMEEDDISDFLNYFVLIVNQPKINTLKDLLRSSVVETVLDDTPLMDIFDKIDGGLRDYIEKDFGINEKANFKEKWISGIAIEHFIEEEKQDISTSFIANAVTLIYEKEIMQYGKFKETDAFKKCLDSFLSNNAQILSINTPHTLLSSIKVLQYLSAKKDRIAEGSRISANLDILKSKGNRDRIVTAFKFKTKLMLVIEWGHFVWENDVKEFYCKILYVVKSNPDKKIIFITPTDSRTIVSDSLSNDSENKGKFILENDVIDLKYFMPKEDQDPLLKEVIIFQGEKPKVNLSSLTGIDSWNDYTSHERCEDEHGMINAATLVKILNNEEVEVGSKPLGTSDLDGAYTVLFEEINIETLANKLKLQDLGSDDIYIISGISDSNKKKKVDTLTQYLGVVDQHDAIEKQVGDIGSDSRIQIADIYFKEENFKQVCYKYTEKRIFWLCIRKEDNDSKLFLQQFYNPKFYIKREFKQVVIKKDIKKLLINESLSETFVFVCDREEFNVLLKLTNETDKLQFDNNCRNNKITIFLSEDDAKSTFQDISRRNQTVHWLKLEEGHFIWKNSHGSLETLREYIDKEESESSLLEEYNLIKMIENRKEIIIADEPGMGKTSTLTQLCNLVTKTHWVIKMNLRDYLQAIRDMEFVKGNTDVVNVVNFLSSSDPKLKSSLSRNVLRIALDKSRRAEKPLFVALDGFDEVLDVSDRSKIVSLLKYLKTETAAKILITTRPHFKKDLEKELSTFAIEFHPLNDKSQEVYVKKYLKDRLCLILSEKIFEKHFVDNVQNKFIKMFLNKMASVFKRNTFRFIGTPLQLYIMLEGSVRHVKIWIEQGQDNDPSFEYLGNDLQEVFEKFIDRKYSIYFKKKDINEYVRQEQEREFLNNCNVDAAESIILNSKPKQKLEKFKDILCAAGIIKYHEDKAEFIHATFRDFYAAELCIQWLKGQPIETMREFLLKSILMKPDYQLTRIFFNLKLEKAAKSLWSEKSLKNFGKIVTKLLFEKPSPLAYDTGTILHIAVNEGNKSIILFLLNMLKGHRNVLECLLFVRNEYERTALHIACLEEDDETVRILLDAAAGISEYALQKYLCFRDGFGWGALDVAVVSGRKRGIEFLKELLNRAQNKLDLITDLSDRKNPSFIPRVISALWNGGCTSWPRKQTSFAVACESGHEEIVRFFIQEFYHDKNSLKKLLLHGDNSLFCACRGCNANIVEILLSVAKSMKDKDVTLKRLLLPKNKNYLPFPMAAARGNLRIVEMLLNAAKDIDDGNHTLKQLLYNKKLDSQHFAPKMQNSVKIL